jgi:hypothetical protein
MLDRRYVGAGNTLLWGPSNGSIVISQQRAMLRLVGKETNLYPTVFIAAAKVDVLMDAVDDIAAKRGEQIGIESNANTIKSVKSDLYVFAAHAFGTKMGLSRTSESVFLLFFLNVGRCEECPYIRRSSKNKPTLEHCKKKKKKNSLSNQLTS